MKRTRLYSVYTDELAAVKKVFLASIKDNWEVHIQHLGKAGEGEGDFSSIGFYDVQRLKVEYQVEKIKENWGDIIIYADIDIQFFEPCADLINKEIEGNDVVFQAEHLPERNANVGFAIIRCNEKTLALYQSVLLHDFTKHPIADQTAMNISLNDNIGNVKWDILPNRFWAMSHYAHNETNPPFDIVLHHANCTHPKVIDGRKVGSVELKLEQFETVRKYVDKLKENKTIYHDSAIDNISDSKEIEQLLSKMNAEVFANGGSDEETRITFAFYLQVALLKVNSSLGLNFDKELNSNHEPLNEENAITSFDENKEMLIEIYNDIMCDAEDLPAWLKTWMDLCRAKISQTGNLNSRQILYITNKQLGITENMHQILSYFLKQVFLIHHNN